MNVLLCLLSRQHIPNLLAVHHFTPDQLVLIESRDMKDAKAVQRFLDALKLGGLDYAGRHYVQPLTAEDNLEIIRQALREAYGRFPSAQWIANVTGGTKPMSLAAHEFFKALAGRVVYTNVVRPNEIIDLTTNGVERCEYRVSIKEFLAGYGFEIRNPQDKVARASQRALSWEKAARTIAASEEGLRFDLNDATRKRSRDKGLELNGELDHVRSPAVQAALAEAFRLHEANGQLKGQLDKYGVRFLTGGWLEVLMWNQLRRHAGQLGLWDVCLGLEVGHTGANTGNDLDVGFMHNWNLCVVECKTGGQQHDPDGDVLYKLEAIINQFGALRVRSWLATTSANILNKDGAVKDNISNRARISGCTLVLNNQIAELAACHEDPNVLGSILFPARKVAGGK